LAAIEAQRTSAWDMPTSGFDENLESQVVLPARTG
jgi:hypothetical protein